MNKVVIKTLQRKNRNRVRWANCDILQVQNCHQQLGNCEPLKY